MSVSYDVVGPRRLRQLLDAVIAVGSGLELSTLLERITWLATQLVDARYGALGVLDGQRTGLTEFVTAGIDDETRADIGDTPSGRGILGLLIDEPKPDPAARSQHPSAQLRVPAPSSRDAFVSRRPDTRP